MPGAQLATLGLKIAARANAADIRLKRKAFMNSLSFIHLQRNPANILAQNAGHSNNIGASTRKLLAQGIQ